MASNDPDKPKPERPTFIIQATNAAASGTGITLFRLACLLAIAVALTYTPAPAQLVGLLALTVLAVSLGRLPKTR